MDICCIVEAVTKKKLKNLVVHLTNHDVDTKSVVLSSLRRLRFILPDFLPTSPLVNRIIELSFDVKFHKKKQW